MRLLDYQSLEKPSSSRPQKIAIKASSPRPLKNHRPFWFDRLVGKPVDKLVGEQVAAGGTCERERSNTQLFSFANLELLLWNSAPSRHKVLPKED